MENIRKNLDELKLILEENKDMDNIFNRKLLEIVNGLYNNLEETQVNLESVAEDLSLINDDLSEVQEEVFEELSFEELEEYEDEYVEVRCSNCDKPIFVEKSVLKSEEGINCPYCENKIK